MMTIPDPRQEWRTPTDFLRAVWREFGTITVDVAASVGNKVCERFIDREADGLAQPWFPKGDGCRALPTELAWCNPGFKSMAAWVVKAWAEIADAGLQPRTALVLCLCAPSTAWWRDAIEHGAEVRLLSPRVQFDPPPGIPRSSNPRECALLVFRDISRAVVQRHREGHQQTMTWWWKEQP